MEPELCIKYWRKVRSMTQQQLSEKINMSDNYLSELENGRKHPSLYLLYKIAEALEVCPKALLNCKGMECRTCSYNIVCKETEEYK